MNQCLVLHFHSSIRLGMTRRNKAAFRVMCFTQVNDGVVAEFRSVVCE